MRSPLRCGPTTITTRTDPVAAGTQGCAPLISRFSVTQGRVLRYRTDQIASGRWPRRDRRSAVTSTGRVARAVEPSPDGRLRSGIEAGPVPCRPAAPPRPAVPDHLGAVRAAHRQLGWNRTCVSSPLAHLARRALRPSPGQPMVEHWPPVAPKEDTQAGQASLASLAHLVRTFSTHSSKHCPPPRRNWSAPCLSTSPNSDSTA
jgi:hypothetical protein